MLISLLEINFINFTEQTKLITSPIEIKYKLTATCISLSGIHYVLSFEQSGGHTLQFDNCFCCYFKTVFKLRRTLYQFIFVFKLELNIIFFYFKYQFPIFLTRWNAVTVCLYIWTHLYHNLLSYCGSPTLS